MQKKFSSCSMKKKKTVFRYKTVKDSVYVLYDVLSVLVILLSFDKIYKMKSFKSLQPWQLARLIERIPKLVQTFKKF